MEKCKLICKFRFTNIDKNGWGGGGRIKSERRENI